MVICCAHTKWNALTNIVIVKAKCEAVFEVVVSVSDTMDVLVGVEIVAVGDAMHVVDIC